MTRFSFRSTHPSFHPLSSLSRLVTRFSCVSVESSTVCEGKGGSPTVQPTKPGSWHPRLEVSSSSSKSTPAPGSPLGPDCLTPYRRVAGVPPVGLCRGPHRSRHRGRPGTQGRRSGSGQGPCRGRGVEPWGRVTEPTRRPTTATCRPTTTTSGPRPRGSRGPRPCTDSLAYCTAPRLWTSEMWREDGLRRRSALGVRLPL